MGLSRRVPLSVKSICCVSYLVVFFTTVGCGSELSPLDENPGQLDSQAFTSSLTNNNSNEDMAAVAISEEFAHDQAVHEEDIIVAHDERDTGSQYEAMPLTNTSTQGARR